MDVLQLDTDALKRRQLVALVEATPESFEGRERRLREGVVEALSILDGVVGGSTDLRRMVDEVVAIGRTDDRYAFLDAIPDAPVLSMSRAVALERAVFGDSTHEVAEISLLMGIFTVLLDGLLDEVPRDLLPVRHWLDHVMEPANWGDEQGAAPVAGSPVADAVCWLATAVISRVTQSRGWLDDPLVREQFASATRAAYESELASADLSMSAGAEPAVMHEHVLAKSTSPIWAGALVPFCVRGWPDGLDPDEFRSVACRIGEFGGWVDDVVDVAEDLRADRWSQVTLAIQRCATELGLPLGGDPRATLIAMLSSPAVADHLAGLGVDRLRAVDRGLAGLLGDLDHVRSALADMAYECLTIGIADPPS